MTELLFELLSRSAKRTPTAPALSHKGRTLNYATVASQVERCAGAIANLEIGKLDRIGIYLPKLPEAVVAIFGIARAGCTFVPINPLLKPAQVGHILRDCNVRVLITSLERATILAAVLSECPDLRHLIVVGEVRGAPALARIAVHSWERLSGGSSARRAHRVIDTDIVSIFYTSGSTGAPKGVVLSHRNMVTGAHSVAQYLGNVSSDRLLAALPFSFDYGFSQLSTAFHVGASVTLIDYLFPQDILSAFARDKITGLAGVPPLWAQLADLVWPAEATAHLRYLTNSGGAMPRAILQKLRSSAPRAQVFLMYGLTEAFRSTYLDPDDIDRRPDSIGKAIPNAEILVVRPDGSLCSPNEPGELVHRGSLVALGYWNDPIKTAERYKPVSGQPSGLMLPEMAVWSGDTVRMDEEGYLFFVGRRDEMIKTSGYRVSPTEVEEVIYSTGLVTDAVAVGVPHPTLGQAIAVVAAVADTSNDSERVLEACRSALPNFMVPLHIEWRESLPRNPNGKFDRQLLAIELRSLFDSSTGSLS